MIAHAQWSVGVIL